MSGQLNKHAYEQLIKENIDWLKNLTPDTLERKHIIDIMNASIEYEYAEPPRNQTIQTCPDCEGQGHEPCRGEDCAKCEGSGEIESELSV